MAELRLGVWQAPAELNGLDARLAWLASACADASEVDIAVVPELFLSGYHAGEDTIDRVARDQERALAAVSALAKQHSTALVVGYPEDDNGKRHNSACLIGADGQVLTCHRKRVLPPGFETTCFEPGDHAPVVVTVSGVKVALLVCFEVEFPEAVRACALAGAELVIVPTALGVDWGVVSEKVVPARAFENTVFVAYANHAGSEAGERYLGGSCVVGGDGLDIARAGTEPALLQATIDTDLLVPLRKRLPFLAQCRSIR